MGMGGISIWQLLIILVIVLLVFGTKRLSGLGSDLGNAIKGFRGAMKDGDEEAGADPQKLEQADPKGPAADAAAPKSATADAAPKAAAADTAGADKNPPKV